jgi:hypothetical protein
MPHGFVQRGLPAPHDHGPGPAFHGTQCPTGGAELLLGKLVRLPARHRFHRTPHDSPASPGGNLLHVGQADVQAGTGGERLASQQFSPARRNLLDFLEFLLRKLSA